MKKTFRSIMAIAIAAMTFTACEDVPAPYDVFADEQSNETPSVVAEGSGTLADPFNVAAVLEYVNTLGTAESADQVYVKGIVASITEIAQGNFGNATYTISDDGTSNNIFTVYRSKNLGNTNFTSADELAVGDEVVVVGKVVNYNGKTPEFVQNASYLYSRNGKTSAGGSDQPAGEAKGSGTQTDPYNVAAALAKCAETGETTTTEKYYAKGYVTSITEIEVSQYGNATFLISDDKNGSNKLTVYRALGPGNKKITDPEIVKVGDEVIICGQLVNFRGNTPEFTQGCYIYSINGKSEGGSDTPTTKTHGTADAPVALSEVISIINAMENGATTDDLYYVGGTITTIKTTAENIAKYKNIDYIISDGTNEVTVFRGKNLNNTDFTAEGQINVGDQVVVLGKLQKYVNTNSGEVIPEVAQGNYLVKLNGKSEGGNTGGNDNPNPGGGDVVSGNTISYDFSAQGFENATAIEGITLSDGTTLTFAGGTNSNVPKYYNSGTAVRLYPGNSMTVTAKKTITAIELTCSANNAEGQVSAAPGTVEVNDMTVNITAINAASTVVTNAHTGTGATSQLRIKTLKITYAE